MTKTQTVAKPFWASKTIWTNVVGLGLILATAFGLDLGLGAEQQLTIVAGILVIANTYLRFITTEAVK